MAAVDRSTSITSSQIRKHTLQQDDINPASLVWQEPVEDKDLTSPPSSGNAEGDRYIVAAGASGDWSGQDDKIAQYINDSWSFYTPLEGWFVWVEDEDKLYRFDGSSWAEFSAHSMVDSDAHTDKVDYIDIPYSPTLLTGGILSDGTDAGKIKISALTALIRIDTGSTDALQKITLTEQDNQVLASADTIYYVVLDYNSDTPQIVIQEAEPNNTNQIQIGRCMKEDDDTIHWRNSGFRFAHGIQKTNERIRQLHEWQISKNIVIADEGSKQFSISAGSFFRGLSEQIFPGFDSSVSANVFTYVHFNFDGDTWVYTPDQTDIDVDNYNLISEGTGLESCTKYKCDWVFVHPDEGEVYVVYGQLNGNIGQISDSRVPTLPDMIDVFGALVGRIIVDGGVATFERIEMISTTTFNTQVVIDHNDNSNIQGGSETERYHLTESENSALHAANADTALGAQAEDLDMNTHKIVGVTDPISDQDAETKKHVADNFATIAIANKSTIGINIDGGGIELTTGYKGFIRIPYACTITKATLLGDISGDIVIDLWKCSYADYDAGDTHPVDGDSITASAPPTLSGATKSEDDTLTAWTTSITAGDIIAFSVDSITDITKVTLILEVTKI